MSFVLCISLGYAQNVRIYTTTGDRSQSLSESTRPLKQAASASNVILLHPEQANQNIDGFGFALTYSSCYNLLRMDHADRAALLRKTYSTTEGYGVSYARISIGCNDFSSTEYTLCDKKGLQNFCLYKDETDYVIPVLKEILAINPALKIIAAPWTCPRWMKVNNLSERQAWNSWTDGHLNPACYEDYANYFVKFIDAMANNGIRIYAVSPQNEPLNKANCASLYMPWSEEADFVKVLARAFKKNGKSTKIYVFDHNYNYDNQADQNDYPIKVYNRLGTGFDGEELVVGAAYHNYGGSPSEMSDIHIQAPTKELIFTEASIGTWNQGHDLNYSLMDCMNNIAIGTLLNHCRAVVVWNLMLDRNMGPNLDGGCQTCYGAIDINQQNYQDYTLNSHYYAICHLSAVVRPGAVRINTSGYWANQLSYAAFRNPDNSLAIIFCNESNRQLSFTVSDGIQQFTMTIPKRSAVSCIWQSSVETGVLVLGETADYSTSGKTRPIFDLQGRPYNSKSIIPNYIKKGIYLLNGRKYMIR